MGGRSGFFWELRMGRRDLLSTPQSVWGAVLGISPRGYYLYKWKCPQRVGPQISGKIVLSPWFLTILLCLWNCRTILEGLWEAENISLPMNLIYKPSVYPYQWMSGASGVQGPPLNWIPLDSICTTWVNMEMLRRMKHKTLKCTNNGGK